MMTDRRKCKGQTMQSLGQTEYDYIAVADAGNSGSNAVSVKGDGTCFVSSFSVSARSTVNLSDFDSEEIRGLMQKVDLYEWRGQFFAFGDDAALFPETIERNQGNLRYGDDAHQFYVAASLLNMGIHGSVDLTLFVPPGLFNTRKEDIQTAFTGKTVEIAVKTKEGIEFRSEITYDNVRVLPEGMGVVFCNRYHPDGSPNDKLLKYVSGEAGIVDIGNFSIDVLRVLNGKFDGTKIVTFQDEGVQKHIKERILDALKKQNVAFAYIMPEDIDYAIREGNCRLIAPNGQEINFKGLYTKYAAEYARFIRQEIIQKVFPRLEGMNGIFLIGGGAKAVRHELANDTRIRVFDPDAVGSVDETEVNAIGGLRFVLFNYFHKAVYPAD